MIAGLYFGMSDSLQPPALQEALDAHRSGDFESAERGYRAVLETDPDHIDALHLLATLKLQTGAAEEALVLADKVIALAPDIADAYGNRGSALQALERLGEAAYAFRRGIELAPGAAHLHFNLGNALRADGDKAGAVRAYRDALVCDSTLAQAHSNLGASLSELGLFDDAAAHCQTAVKIAPGYAEAHYNLGNAYRELGRFGDALTSYETAVQLFPAFADAACNHGLVKMRDDPKAAIQSFAHALTVDPDHPMARFYQGIAMSLSGGSGDAAFAMLDSGDPMSAAWLDSWRYIQKHADASTVLLHDPLSLLSFALGQTSLDGLTLEFGVRHGQSIRHIANSYGGRVHGFDSFTGLPSAWGGEPEGVYSTEGELPDVPPNVNLHQGLFEDTLPGFLEAHDGPIRFCNIDCDLYASTVTVLEALTPRIQPGTVLVFDEYLVNPTWREDEYRAFQEAVSANGWSYRYLAFGIVTKQAAVVIV